MERVGESDLEGVGESDLVKARGRQQFEKKSEKEMIRERMVWR